MDSRRLTFSLSALNDPLNMSKLYINKMVRKNEKNIYYWNEVQSFLGRIALFFFFFKQRKNSLYGSQKTELLQFTERKAAQVFLPSHLPYSQWTSPDHDCTISTKLTAQKSSLHLPSNPTKEFSISFHVPTSKLGIEILLFQHSELTDHFMFSFHVSWRDLSKLQNFLNSSMNVESLL